MGEGYYNLLFTPTPNLTTEIFNKISNFWKFLWFWIFKTYFEIFGVSENFGCYLLHSINPSPLIFSMIFSLMVPLLAAKISRFLSKICIQFAFLHNHCYLRKECLALLLHSHTKVFSNTNGNVAINSHGHNDSHYS